MFTLDGSIGESPSRELICDAEVGPSQYTRVLGALRLELCALRPFARFTDAQAHTSIPSCHVNNIRQSEEADMAAGVQTPWALGGGRKYPNIIYLAKRIVSPQ